MATIGWVEKRPHGLDSNRYWYNAALDNDGSHIIAPDYNGRVWLSVDYGENWSEVRPAGDVNKGWFSVDMDDDGSHILIGVSNGRLYSSSNSGANWTERTPSGSTDRRWQGRVSVDSDGSHAIVAYLGNDTSINEPKMYTSANSFVSWTERDPASLTDGYYFVFNDRKNGQYAVALGSANTGSNKLYVSSDYGVNWTERLSDYSNYFQYCAISEAAEAIYTHSPTGGHVYKSTNKGVDWSSVTPSGSSGYVQGIACDKSGDKVLVCRGGRLYYSEDGGSNWVEQRPAGDVDKEWRCLALSGDGNYMIAAVPNGRLYLGTYGTTYEESASIAIGMSVSASRNFEKTMPSAAIAIGMAIVSAFGGKNTYVRQAAIAMGMAISASGGKQNFGYVLKRVIRFATGRKSVRFIE